MLEKVVAFVWLDQPLVKSPSDVVEEMDSRRTKSKYGCGCPAPNNVESCIIFRVGSDAKPVGEQSLSSSTAV